MNRYENEVDEIWSTGDLFFPYANDDNARKKVKAVISRLNVITKPFFSCQGNCDDMVDRSAFLFALMPRYLILERNGTSFVLTHGDMYSGIQSQVNLAKSNQCRVLFSGHTHNFGCRDFHGVVCCNLGSPSYPRDLKKIPMVGLLDIDLQVIKLVDIRTWESILSITY